jgi:hypothetical protein
MTFEELAQLVVPGVSVETLRNTPVTFEMLCKALEACGTLLHRRRAGDVACPGCAIECPGWPDTWRWSKKHGAYVCADCVAKEHL